MDTDTIKEAMRILWEGEGHQWKELYEYPYSGWESDAIVERLRKTAKELEALFTK